MAVSTEGDDFMADTSEESPVSLPGSDSDQDDHVAIENAIQAYVPKELAPPGPVDFMEVFSPPRIWPHAERLGLRCGPSVDIETGFDLLTDLGREACMKLIYNLQPAVIMLSPPCTVFSQLQKTNEYRRRDYEAWNRQYQDGLKLWQFALFVFRCQLAAGRRAVLEHPWLATSWTLPCTLDFFRSNSSVVSYVFDQCLHGLKMQQNKMPIRKRTKFASNWPLIGAHFQTRCTAETCNHLPRTHVRCQGFEAGQPTSRWAQVYPDGLCATMARCLHQARQAGDVVGPMNEESDVELPVSD